MRYSQLHFPSRSGSARDTDAAALSLAIRQLDSTANPARQEELDRTIVDASERVRAQIFYRAQEVRNQNWKDVSTKAAMERTIPVFRALANSDGVYHRNYGQLGYPLEDQRKPDWPGAAAALTKAIGIRGPWREKGWLFYDNRAICRINQDPDFLAGKASAPERRRLILEDLRAASTDDYIAPLMGSNESIYRWIELNQITEKDFRTVMAAVQK